MHYASLDESIAKHKRPLVAKRLMTQQFPPAQLQKPSRSCRRGDRSHGVSSTILLGLKNERKNWHESFAYFKKKIFLDDLRHFTQTFIFFLVELWAGACPATAFLERRFYENFETCLLKPQTPSTKGTFPWGKREGVCPVATVNTTYSSVPCSNGLGPTPFWSFLH